MEIGSFIEMQFNKSKEYYNYSNQVRLNSGRAAIYHAFRVTKCNSIWIPYYQCDTVRNFLTKKNVNIKYYHIDEEFNPIDIKQDENEAVLLVNYYGIMSNSRMKKLSINYQNVIIDNSQAFFCKPLDNCLNVYSCRKFVGVPDGSYVIGDNVSNYYDEYEQGYSSDTSLFLLQRIEYGCEGKSYASRSVNESRLDVEDIKKMSKLTTAILDGTDYEYIIKKRKENFKYISDALNDINKLNVNLYYDNTCVPMVYPLVVENDELINILQKNKHFQGHWWSYLLDEVESSTFEYWVSRYVIPLTIDQRYSKKELDYIIKIIKETIK